MKKFIFIFFLFLEFRVLSFPLLALNPVVIKKADFGAPPSNNKLSDDSIFYPNGTGLTCRGSYSISETFKPKETTTTDAQGNTVTTTTPITVTSISGKVPLLVDKFWTNPGPKHMDAHLNNNPKVVLNDIDGVQKAFLSYNPRSDVGSFGAGSKSMPDQVLKCLVGQRLVKAVRLARGDEGGSFSNQQIAWDNGGRFDPVTDTGQDTGKKVQLDDIAVAMNKDPYLSFSETTPEGKPIRTNVYNPAFYDPDANCYDTTETAPVPNDLNAFVPANSPSFDHIEPEDAVSLYKTLGPIGSGPSRRDVETCSESATGGKFGCEKKKSNIPRGETLATSQPLSRMVKPEEQEVPVKDLCVTNPEYLITDEPNPVSFLEKVYNDFVEIVDAVKTISHPMSYEFKIDNEVQAGISADETSQKDLLPQEGLDNSCISDTAQGFSSTNSKSFDPGNDCTRSEVAKWLLPESEHL